MVSVEPFGSRANETPSWKQSDAVDAPKEPPRDAVDRPPARELNVEQHRYDTFAQWNYPYPDKTRLARSGFYYYGEGDRVRCYFCKVEIGHWEEDDNPAVDHQRWSPSCPLVTGFASDNIPLESDDRRPRRGAPPSEGAGRDVCGSDDSTSGGPARPAYQRESARLKSFEDWPCRMKQTPAAMADAGFYYTGSGDRTVCYHCAGGLKDWEDDDDPWVQHARWFPNCDYVRLVKGRDFVKSVESNATRRDCEPRPEPPAAEGEVLRLPLGEASESASLCRICYDSERNVCFVPCGHLLACGKCAVSLDKCPVCREKIESKMRIYI